jgi:hypothetical protein
MEWQQRWETDPKFRLDRLILLRKRHYREKGGPYAGSNAYDDAIAWARKEVAKEATQ